MKNVVLYSTGFILPLSESMQLIDNKNLNDVVGGIEKLEVYTSFAYSQALNEYFSHQTPENYMNLVDIAIEALQGLSLMDFAKMQVKNPHLSVTGWGFLIYLLSGKLLDNYRMYSVIPNNAKIIVTKTKYDIDVRRKQLADIEKNNERLSWENVLSELADEKGAFIAFYQYLFVGL